MADIKCKECRAVADESEEYCPECGAIFMEPFEYVKDEAEVMKTVEVKQKKSFDEMNREEKIHQLTENCNDVRDEIVKLRHHIKQKADECMRCFTAAGISRSQDYDDDTSNILWKRKENIEEADMVIPEYRNLLEKLQIQVDALEAEKEKLAEFKKNN